MKDSDKTRKAPPGKGKHPAGRKRKGRGGRDWETASFAGLMFALSEYRGRLEEQRAFKLNSRPREIDVRIIDRKHGDGERMDNAIAYLFERHNIVELKNPYEALNIDTVWKGISYAAQYKSRGYDDTTEEKGVDAVPMKDVTLTFLRIARPEGLFEMMRASGYAVEERFPGVYHIAGMADIKMQVVVGSELEGDEFAPLRIQKKNASEEDLRLFKEMAERLTGKRDRDLASAIADVSMSENRSLFERLKEEDPDMRKAVMEIFKDEIEAEKKEAVNKAVNKAVNEAVSNTSEDIAKKMLKDKKPFEEIFKYTLVPIDRLKELAKMFAGTPARG